MVTAELNASKIKEPFLVFTGTKMEDAKTEVSRWQTNNYKFSAWRADELGVFFANFQHKYWFDEVVSISYLNTLVNEIHPGLKVGLILDKELQYCGKKVIEHIEQLKASNKLVAKTILGMLTSIMQVCNLHGNKSLKQLIKNEYYKQRMEKIKAEREK